VTLSSTAAQRTGSTPGIATGPAVRRSCSGFREWRTETGSPRTKSDRPGSVVRNRNVISLGSRRKRPAEGLDRAAPAPAAWGACRGSESGRSVAALRRLVSRAIAGIVAPQVRLPGRAGSGGPAGGQESFRDRLRARTQCLGVCADHALGGCSLGAVCVFVASRVSDLSGAAAAGSYGEVNSAPARVQVLPAVMAVPSCRAP